MRDVIRATGHRAPRPAIVHIEHQRRIDVDRRMQTRGRLPRAKAHAADVLAVDAGRSHRHARSRCSAIDESFRSVAGHLHLQPFERRVDVAHRTARRALFAHHVPRLQRLAQFERHVAVADLAVARESGTRNAAQTNRVPADSPPGSCRRSAPQGRCQTKCGSMKRSCSSVPQRTRSRSIRRLPEARDQRQQQLLLRKAHLRVRRHLERAEFDETEPPCWPVRRIQLVDADFRAMRVAGHVDQQVAEDPIDEPRRRRAIARDPALR